MHLLDFVLDHFVFVEKFLFQCDEPLVYTVYIM